MRILKYFLLLFILFSVGAFVFIATQKPNFNISKSLIVKTPKALVYNYVNDFRNWETFGSWVEEDKDIKFTYPEKTSGIGASSSWKSDMGDVTTKTISEKQNTFINQKMTVNGVKSDIKWTFEEVKNGTKVTWQQKGNIDFSNKFMSFFSGGVNTIISNRLEKSLYNLNKTLSYELSTFKVNLDGFVNRDFGYYVMKTISCKVKSVQPTIKNTFPKLDAYFKKNDLKINGKPFVIYDYFDEVKDSVSLSVCYPVKDSLQIVGAIYSAKMPKMYAAKTTLKGDYTHLPTAWAKSVKLINDYKKIRANSQVIEVYKKSSLDIKSPSKWETEIYIPLFVKSAFVPKKIYKKRVNDSLSVTKPETPETPINTTTPENNPVDTKTTIDPELLKKKPQ